MESVSNRAISEFRRRCQELIAPEPSKGRYRWSSNRRSNTPASLTAELVAIDWTAVTPSRNRVSPEACLGYLPFSREASLRKLLAVRVSVHPTVP